MLDMFYAQKPVYKLLVTERNIIMKIFASLFITMMLFFSAGAYVHAEEIKSADAKSNACASNVKNEFLENSLTQGGSYCLSARNCGGKVLSNRDPHNCKNNDGKSWSNDRNGNNCQNL